MASAFLQVTNLLVAPQSHFSPRVALRVLRAQRRAHLADAQAAVMALDADEVVSAN